MLKKDSGVSLITLIITIIVVIILAVIAMVGTGGTIEEANFATYSQNLGNVQEHFTEKATTVRGNFMVNGRVITEAQTYNYVARGGKTGEDVIENADLPEYTIITEESGITLPKMKVESPTGMLVELKYAVTSDGIVFTYPPFQYDGKLYVTAEDIVGTVKDGVTEGFDGSNITVGEKEIEISQNTDKGTLIPEGEMEGKITLGELAIKGKLQVGDKVAYVPETATYTTNPAGQKDYYTGEASETLTTEENTEWIVAKINENNIVLVQSNSGRTGIAIKPGALFYLNGPSILNDACKALYSNSKLGAVARNATFEDFGYTVEDSDTKYAYYASGANLSSVTAPSGYTKVIASDIVNETYVELSYSGYRFWGYDSAPYTGSQTIGSYSYTYGYPTKTQPVLVTAKNYVLTDGNEKLLNSIYGGYLAERAEYIAEDVVSYYMPLIEDGGELDPLMAVFGPLSSGQVIAARQTIAAQPAVVLPNSIQIDGQDANGAWQIVY